MSRRRLTLVSGQEHLSGGTLADWERLARGAALGSPDHVACVALALTLARYLVPLCVAPRGQGTLNAALDCGWKWVAEKSRRGAPTQEEAEGARRRALDARNHCFQEVGAIESATLKAVTQAAQPTASRATGDARRDALAESLRLHARHVIERYVGLFAHFTVSAVCHALDSIERPATSLTVFEDARGARAYQAAGLGAARQDAFVMAAADQACWEADRTGAGSAAREELQHALAIQVFHEYLGGRYRSHADQETVRQHDFTRWALSGRRG